MSQMMDGPPTETTDSSSQFNFNPQSMGLYNSFLGTAGPILQNFASNPYGNDFFKKDVSMVNNQALGLGQRGVSTLMSNGQQSGFGNMPGFMQSQLARQGRATASMQAQGKWGAMQRAQQMQQMALGQMMGFQPLITGQKSHSVTTMDQKKGWLGPALKLGLGLATGGLSTVAGAAAGGLGGSLGGAFSQMASGGLGQTGFNFGQNIGNYAPNPFGGGAGSGGTPYSMSGGNDMYSGGINPNHSTWGGGSNSFMQSPWGH